MNLRTGIAFSKGTVGIVPRDANGHQRPENSKGAEVRNGHNQADDHKDAAPDNTEGTLGLTEMCIRDRGKSRREGKTVFYSLADDHVKTIIDQGLEHVSA